MRVTSDSTVRAGTAIVEGAGLDDGAAGVWAVVRWPIGLVLASAGLYLMFRAAPSRRLGSGVQAYGPVLAVIALVLWSGLTSLSVHLGIATTVEAERADGRRT